MHKKKINQSELSFEAALKKLEQAVETLESRELDLDKSLEIFEEGIKLSRICNKILDTATRKIEILLGENNNKHPAPFNTD